MTERLVLSRDQIVELLQHLGARLEKEGVHGELYIVGGAAMALAFNTRRLTADVDGVFEPKMTVYRVAREIADELGTLPADWLNDGVKGLLAPGISYGASVVLDVPGLTVSVPSARYLLALKVQASRVDRDQDDIRALAALVGASTAGEVLAVAESVIGASRLLPKARFLVEEMFGAAPGDSSAAD